MPVSCDRDVLCVHIAHNLAMRISLITPSLPDVWSGNRVTAQRWAGMLQELGHDVAIGQAYSSEACDLLIALHARKSADSIERFADEQPNRPIIVALTGTDVYHDLSVTSSVLTSLEKATRIVTLQPNAVDELPKHLRACVRVIYQSVLPPSDPPAKRIDVFEVCVIGNLRDVKDPFRTAAAVKMLPKTSRIRVIHIGAALSTDMEHRANQETQTNDRYEWIGPLPREEAMRHLAGSRLMVLTSQMEGGANVVSEAVVCSVPVISSRIAGSIGLLGENYPGYFPVGDTPSLTALLRRCETDETFYKLLIEQAACVADRFHPDHERTAWKNLLDELLNG